MSLRRLFTGLAFSTAALLAAQQPKDTSFRPAPEQPRKPTVTIDSIGSFETFWNDKVKSRLRAKNRTAAKPPGFIQLKKGFDGIYLSPNVKSSMSGFKNARLGILNAGRSSPVLNYTVFPTMEKDSLMLKDRRHNELFLLMGGSVDLGTKDVTFSPAIGYAPRKGLVFGANASAFVNAGGKYQTLLTAYAFFGSVATLGADDPEDKTTGLLNYGFGANRFLGGDDNYNDLYLRFDSYRRPGGEYFDLGGVMTGHRTESNFRVTAGWEKTLGCIDFRKGSYDLTGAVEFYVQHNAEVIDYGLPGLRTAHADASVGAALASFISVSADTRLGLRMEQGFTKDQMNPKSSGTSVSITARKLLRPANQRKNRAQF